MPHYAKNNPKKLDLKSAKLRDSCQQHKAAVRAKCGHKTYIVHVTSGECYECYLAAVREAKRNE